MDKKIFKIVLFALIFYIQNHGLLAQKLDVELNGQLVLSSLGDFKLDKPIPLFSFTVNDEKNLSDKFKIKEGQWLWEDRIVLNIDSIQAGPNQWTAVLTFKNISRDTLILENLIPFGGLPDQFFITGSGKHTLSRSHLFRPNFKPVNVILPDNAWELGYASVQSGEMGIAALMRRKYWGDGAIRRRFETILPPGGNVTYRCYMDNFSGDWQEGLRTVFQKKYLYDLESFDNSLYEREDLKWIRKAYAMHLLMAWDKDFYHVDNQEFKLLEFQKRNENWFGGDDVIGIWPTWPTLGLDQRNQWDMYRDLPGGLDQLSHMSDSLRLGGTKFFIAYNPWDESTRLEGHLEGMQKLIEGTNADGVVLDTKGSSSNDLQEAADSVKEGVVMYSEGMAVPKDMPGIVSGRVHNALYYPPLLNLNKIIKPDFAIFRVAELAYERIRREYALSMFNGYGTELNIFRPGRPEWKEEDYKFFGRTLRVLRENHSNFTAYDYTPLIKTLEEGIFVNKWPKENKVIYTIFSLKPEGFLGNLFEVNQPKYDWHYIDLWNHEEVQLSEKEGSFYVPVDLESFHQKWLGTNNEGAVSAIAYLPNLLEIKLIENKLYINSLTKGDVRVWAGNPSYGKDFVSLYQDEEFLDIRETFRDFEGKLVVQLFEGEELLDERIITMDFGDPRLISVSEKTVKLDKIPEGMVRVPKGSFIMKVSQGDQFIPYPVENFPKELKFQDFYMDKHPVTNQEFKTFLESTGYSPKDPHRFLAHWLDGDIPKGKELHPVVNVSYEDAKAYASWAGKRLPTEAEWQYAASAGDGRDWPWDPDLKVSKRREFVTNTLTVEHLDGLETDKCNIGNGILDAVGSYPNGSNPWGLEDLVGSVWQMTNDLYDNGTNQMILLKGGSYFKPSSSWWYVQGGPREIHYRQMLLRVSPGFERNETVGFRCVADIFQ
ncbi:formylglycine-generating enzyme family protein [Shivajiella indica]|uniref:Formylglycine-generating enzyme family protein n=1 Tax=Shivajiella indica TaxID=872115 RepID=A0ABW5B983_9BACT